MFQHFSASIAPLKFLNAVQPYELGSLAVLVFFCLSGFVIAEAANVAYANKPLAFMANRGLRIIPHFVVAILCSIAIQRYFYSLDSLYVSRDIPVVSERIFSFGNILRNFVSIIPYADRETGNSAHRFIPIVWAVRVEVAFYFAIFASLLVANYFEVYVKQPGFEKSAAMLFFLFLPLFTLRLFGKLPVIFGFFPYFSFGVAV